MDLIKTKRLNTVVLLMVVLCLGLAAAGSALAQRNSGGLISLDVAEIELSTVVRMLARDSGQNIVVADNDKLRTKVSATLTNVTLDTALRYIVESAGCTWSRESDGTYIIGAARPEAPKAADTGKSRQSSLDGGMSSYEMASLASEVRRDIKYESIKLQNTSPVDMMWLLGAYQDDHIRSIKKMTNPPGVRFSSPKWITPVDGTPPLIDAQAGPSGEAGRVLSISDEAGQGAPPPFTGRPPTNTNQPNQPNTGPNQGQSSSSQNLMPSGIDYLMPYPADNSLLVKGTPEGIEELHDLIKKLDIAPKQVSIKAEFVEISTSNSSQLGIEWNVQRLGSVFQTQFNPSGNVIFGYASGNVMANLRTQVLQNKAKLINAPIISTMNNTWASINIQKTIPYWTSSSYYGQNNTQTTQQVQGMEIRSTLGVMPRVNGDGSITVFLSPEVSDQGEMYTGPNGEQLPAVNSQYLETTRRVMNGETIVVGGIIRKTENNSVTGIPLLKDLPLVGTLFRSTTRSTEDRELLIFLTPTILPERSTAGTGVGVPVSL